MFIIKYALLNTREVKRIQILYTIISIFISRVWVFLENFNLLLKKNCDRRIWVDEQLENKCCKQTFPKLLSLLGSNLQKLFRFSVYILFAKRLEKLECYGTVLLEAIFLELEKAAFFAVFFRPNDDNCPKDLVGGSISRPLLSLVIQSGARVLSPNYINSTAAV